MRRAFFISVPLIISVLLCVGCTDSKIDPLAQKINVLESRVDEIEKATKEIQSEVTWISAKEDVFKNIRIDTSAKGFSRLDTELGSFLVMVNDVKPYSSGYKLVLSIGNPYSASFTGIKMKIRWGRAFDRNERKANPNAYDNWKKSLREKEEKMTELLKPGMWNKINLILSPAKAEELGYIEFSMSVDQISLFMRK